MICSGSFDPKELFFNETVIRLLASEVTTSGPSLLPSRFSSWRLDNPLRSGTLPVNSLLARTRLLRLFNDEISLGIFPEMKLELRFRAWREEENLVIFGGRGPEMPRETRDKVFKFESFVRTVKSESVENVLESLTVLFPVTVSSVTWPLKQRILKEGEDGR